MILNYFLSLYFVRCMSILCALYTEPVNSESGWSELLICMMHEYNAQESPWKPYFDVLPAAIDLPMFWTE